MLSDIFFKYKVQVRNMIRRKHSSNNTYCSTFRRRMTYGKKRRILKTQPYSTCCGQSMTKNIWSLGWWWHLQRGGQVSTSAHIVEFSEDWSAATAARKQNYLSAQMVDSLSDEEEGDGDGDDDYEDGDNGKKDKKKRLVGRFPSHLLVALALIEWSEHCLCAEDQRR